MSTTSTEHTRSSVVGGESPQRSRFPWWLLLLALAVIALVAFLLTRGDGDAGEGATTSQQEAAQGADASGDQEASDADADGDGVAEDPDIQPGKITAGGATVYPLSDNLTVADFEGEEVVGRDVPVESVVADVGLWVGTGADDRIFVLVTGAGGESAPEVQAGDTINFEGEVVAHGDDFAQRVGVDRREGAQRLTALRGHVEIPQYRLSGD